MSTLILLRHGQASFGESRYDALSALGRAQAEAAGAWLATRGAAPDCVLHGPRQRHGDTAALLLARAGFDRCPAIEPALDEFGEGEDVLAAAEILLGRRLRDPGSAARLDQLRAYDQAIRAWSRGELRFAGRESFAGFRRRVGAWFSALTGEAGAPSGQTVVAVSSAGVVAAVVCEVLALPDAQWHPLLRVLHNASITEIAYSRGRCGLRSFNATGHLPGDLGSAI